MLLTLKEAIEVAYKNKFALGAFNIGSHEIFKAVMDQCIESASPCIIAIHPMELEYLSDGFIEYIKYIAEKAPIPVVLHLDHGSNIEQIQRAITCGFTSVMIDASDCKFEENITITKEVVKLAKQHNISVESELGTIGDVGNTMEGGHSKIQYTNPSDAQVFVEETKIDALAVAIGTLHGIYPEDFKSQLQFDLLKEITAKTNIPLVLHGGSSNPDSELSRAVSLGVCKINMSSDVKQVMYQETSRYLIDHPHALEPMFIFKNSIERSKKMIKNKLEVFNSIEKASFY
ncbi:MAG: ketose-bisphosphate aldolase [Brevinema sp.]